MNKYNQVMVGNQSSLLGTANGHNPYLGLAIWSVSASPNYAGGGYGGNGAQANSASATSATGAA